MKPGKCFKHAFAMVLHSKLRSWLTIIGIVIGVAAVVAIVSIGEGMQRSLNERLGGLGADIITISPGFSKGSNMVALRGGVHMHGTEGGSGPQATENEAVLTRSDVQVLRGIPDILQIDPNIRGNVEVSYLGKTGTVSITGVDQRVWPRITTSKVKEGRTLDPTDQNVIVIGGRLASSYFGQPIGINKIITIEGSAYRVVGILEDQSNQIYIPIMMAYQILEGKKTDQYDSISVKIREDRLDETIAEIESRLMTSRHLTEKNKDFSVTSSKQLQQTMSETLNSMSAFLIAIAAVSLIVGAVGIANTMFTSVLEKTKQIGIMKAIGARNRDIMLIFLTNSALIGLVGGVLGVIAGIMLSSAMPALMGSLPLGRGGTAISMSSVIMALSVSITVGIAAGLIPAYQASRLKPVDALRYE
ncbi:ABC transporter permease [Candidatus Woesearchaeota archaeon]|nr:ABC transporter permease [Candidatus Woesearchaeota archaeon]